MNTQAIERRSNSTGEELEIIEMFLTIQGEGPFTGHRALFIRLAGCNLQCPGCDTDYTSNRRTLPVENIIRTVNHTIKPNSLVVITGGEPFRQNITVLANKLIYQGHKVQIETNGTYAPSHGLSEKVTIVCSPKAGKINKDMRLRADCYKYVMHADSVYKDGLPIQVLDHSVHNIVARPPAEKPVYLQPMDSQDEEQNLANIIAVRESCIKHGYVLQLQIHKLIGAD